MQLWQLIIDAPLDAGDSLSDAVAEQALAVDIGVDAGRARITGLFAHPLNDDETRALAAGHPHHWAPLEQLDWLAKTARTGAGDIGIFTLLDAPDARTGLLCNRALHVESAHAFGDGFHATTQGCLLALQGIAKRRKISRYADVGCGTGVLALGTRKLFPSARGIAGDIDAAAVDVSRRNRAANGGPLRMPLAVGPGLSPRAYKTAAPYQLIFANILAGPLSRLAPSLAAALAPGGVAVLSGLLASQQNQVLAAYRQQGLALVKSTVTNDWVTLVLRKNNHGRAAA